MTTKEKKGKLYQIYSPSLDKYYYGSTFLPMPVRKAIHKYQCNLIKAGKFCNLRCFDIIDKGDAIFTVLKEYDNISKRDLLDEETKHVMFNKQKLGDKVLNKCNSGLTLNMPEYMKKYKKENVEKFERYKEKFGKEYQQNYKEKNKDVLTAKRKEKQFNKTRANHIIRLNEELKANKNPIISDAKLIKYNISYDADANQYF